MSAEMTTVSKAVAPAPSSPSSPAPVTAASFGIPTADEKARRMLESEIAKLRRVQAEHSLEVPDDLVRAVAKLGMFDVPSLDSMIGNARIMQEVKLRRQMVSVIDSTRERGENTANADLKALTSGLTPDSFITHYLMPGEELRVSMPFAGASVFEHDKHGHRISSYVSQGGTVYLTTKRMILVHTGTDLRGEFLDLQAYEDQLLDNVPAIVELQKKIAKIDSHKGFCGMGLSESKKAEREQLVAELEDLYDIYPQLRLRSRLTFMLSLLHQKVSKCCDFKCKFNCCACCAGKSDSTEFAVLVSQNENFHVQPISLDRMLHAEMNYNVSAYSAAGVEKMEKEGLISCCCSKAEFKTMPRELAQRADQRDLSLSLSALLPPWGNRANIKLRIDKEVPLPMVSAFLANFHLLVPEYRVKETDWDGVTSNPHQFTAPNKQFMA